MDQEYHAPAGSTSTPALRRGLIADGFTNSLYAASPWVGCAHACVYCDGRAEKYHVQGDFGRDIRVKPDFLARLARDLVREREVDAKGRRPLLCLGSGVTDVYQGIEASQGLVRASLELALERGFPVLVMTKSTLYLRDLDLWQELARGPGALIVASINGLDAQRARCFEPGVPEPAERIAALGRLRDAGVSRAVLAMPLLPGMGDDESSLRELYAALRPLEPLFVQSGGLTLRPGIQKDGYLETLAGFAPDLLPQYAGLFWENRASGMPIARASKELGRHLHHAHQEVLGSIPHLLPHRWLRTIVPPWEALSLLLIHMRQLYGERGIDTRRLVEASQRYLDWLGERRSTLRRQRSLGGEWLEWEFQSLLAAGTLETLLDNERLATLLRSILAGAELDYASLQLVPAPGTEKPQGQS